MLFLSSLESFLDVGAGNGEITSYLGNEYNLKGVGIDVKPPKENEWAEWGGRRENIHDISVFDGRHLPFKNDTFDLVIFNMVLHHAADNAAALLHGASRVSKCFILLLEDISVPSSKKITTRHHNHDPKGIFRSETEWISLLENTGYKVVVQATIPCKDGY